MYIHQLAGWPKFRWNDAEILPVLTGVRHRQGRLIGRMEGLGFKLRQEAFLSTLTNDVVKTSEIEGERLDDILVRSSIARHLRLDIGGLEIGGLKRVDREIDGVVEMMLDATRNFERQISAKRLFQWHALLFPAGGRGLTRIRTGAWRDDRTGPMEVVSGAIGKERVHFEAPSAKRLPEEVRRFLHWYNGGEEIDAVLKAAVAHLWFVTVHPFEDGNGRIARAIADMTLARSENSSQRFYSMSSQIRQERSAYYGILEKTQKGPLDITGWIEWFLKCLDRAILSAENKVGGVLSKARFWDNVRDAGLNERQTQILNRLLDGFEGKLTTSKYSKLAKTSPDTALRDITMLVDAGILAKNAEGGRSTSYSVVLPKMH